MSHRLSLAAAAILFFPSTSTANIDVDFEDVPENVLATAQLTAPGVAFDKVSIEVENGVGIYEFEGSDHEGKHIEIDVYANGELEEIEMEIALNEVPGSVMTTLNQHAPGFEPSYIELSIRQTRPQYVYDFKGELAGDFVEIEISEDGKLLHSTKLTAAISVLQTGTEKSATD